MRITSIAIRNFRSLSSVQLAQCAGVNTLIGKNNSGKSNVLAAIDLAIEQLRLGCITSDWTHRGRARDEFSERNSGNRIQIALTFAIPEALGNQISLLIGKHVEGIDVALEQLRDQRQLSIIVCGHLHNDRMARYVQEVSFGGIAAYPSRLSLSGQKIFYLPDPVADEVIGADRRVKELAAQIESLDELWQELKGHLGENKDYRRYVVRNALERAHPALRAQLQKIFGDTSEVGEIETQTSQLKAVLQSSLEEVRSRSTTELMTAFAGSTKKVPDYLPEIIKLLGKYTNIQHFTENRSPIGPEEAAELLRLKTTRGGPAQLSAFQGIVQSLLGVSVDAFSASEEPVRRSRIAEMDIDDFLVEANGAGIREALRIILDLELKKPNIVLVEEPEVHLHPGLEKAIHRYLVEKGIEQQIFLATHSTNFLDVSSQQNIYIVSRQSNKTTIDEAISEEDIMKIPGDIGLRPSTLFMFDRLVFVEGPTDEDVIRTLAKRRNIDLAAKNIGFVKMGGASNAGYFASDATLDLLSKRQIPMTFVIDRDEREEEEIKKLESRLGGRARFEVLGRRELENYLAVPEAIFALLVEKAKTSGAHGRLPENVDEVRETLQETAISMKGRSVELTVRRKLLGPIYIDRLDGNSIQDKWAAAAELLTQRTEKFERAREEIEQTFSANWERVALHKAPGSELLEATFKRYEFKFTKERDAARLAELIPIDIIPSELFGIIERL
jgi:predicted ATP-dependent endonuclease of OLD family